MPAANAPGFRETWEKIPFVTRHLGAAAIVLFAVYAINPFLAARWFWLLPGARWWHLLPYATAPLSYAGNSMAGLFMLFNFCSNLQTLELSVYTKRSDLVGYLMFVGVFLNLVAPRLGVPALLASTAIALQYTVTQQSPWTPVTVYVVTIPQGFLPLTDVVIRFLTGGRLGVVGALLGIVAAHAHLFLTELLPAAGGPRLLSDTPRFLKWWDGLVEDERKRQAFGRGRKLGKQR